MEASEFVERMAGALVRAGLRRAPALVMSALLVDDDGRMTSPELTEEIGLSAASVSGAVTYLTQVAMIRRERAPGSRRDVYVVDEDSWHGVMMQTDQIYAPMIAALDSALAELDSAEPVRRRLFLSREFLHFVDAEMSGLLGRWEIRRQELLRELESRP